MRDLDVCRDTFTADGQWFCPQCESLYEMSYIESLMVDSLHAIHAAEVLQDLQCTKCNMVNSSSARFFRDEKKRPSGNSAEDLDHDLLHSLHRLKKKT